MCNMLIDQGRYIGTEPLGSVCYNEATWETAEGYLVCDRCREMIKANSDRVSFPLRPFGVEQQKVAINKFIKSLESLPKIKDPKY